MRGFHVLAAAGIALVIGLGTFPTTGAVPEGKAQEVRGATSSPDPSTWIYPAQVEAFVYDPNDAPIDPDSEYDEQMENRPNEIRREITAFEKDQRKTGRDHGQDIEQKKAEFDRAAEKRDQHNKERAERKVQHDQAAAARALDRFLRDVEKSGQPLTVNSTDALMGRVVLDVPSLDAAMWIVAHRNVGSVQPIDNVPATADLRFARPSVVSQKIDDDGYAGAAVDVGILDTGVRTTHDYLHETNQNLITATGAGCSGNPKAEHGTWVAGVVNSAHSKQRGAAWDANVWDEKVANDCGSSSATDLQTGLNHLGTNSVKFAVYSYGVTGVHGGANDDTVKKIDWMSWNYNMLVASSAGNLRDHVSPPCTAYNNLCVSGVNDMNDKSRKGDQVWEYTDSTGTTRGTNFGPSSDDRNKPDVAAPAESIKTTGADDDANFDIVSGTSFAAPMVAGVAAQIYDYNALDRREIKAVLVETAEERPQEGVWDPDWGWGYLHAYEALKLLYAGTAGTATVSHGNYVTLISQEYNVGDMASATITWNRKGDTTCCNQIGIADVDLMLFSPSGAKVGGSESGDENVEHAVVTITENGIYTWKAYGFNLPATIGNTVIGWAAEPNSEMTDCIQPLLGVGQSPQSNCSDLQPPEIDDVVDVPDAEYLEYIQFELDEINQIEI